MKLLFSHINYPAQFRRLIPFLVNSGHDVVFLCRQREWHSLDPSGFKLVFYSTEQRDSLGTHPYLRRLDDAVVEGQEAFRAGLKLKDSGWYPDCIISHVGFGNGLFLRDCFPLARRIGLVEWFYNAKNSDVDFFPPHHVSYDHKLQLRIWNAECLLEISTLDTIVVPTVWQQQQFPNFVRDHLHVIHEGIDTTYLGSLKLQDPARPLFLPSDPDIQILTYVSRSFEDYRGFSQFIKSLPFLLELLPKLHVLIVGQDGTSYGAPSGTFSSSQEAKKYLKAFSSRVHWLGLLQETDYHSILSISDVHFYLSVPFVLSWSLLEAMAVGCPLVVSDTPPLREVLINEHSALFVDFFDTQAQVKCLHRVLTDTSLSERLSTNARFDVNKFSCDKGHKAWFQMISS